MSSNYDKVGKIEHSQGVKGGEGSTPDWAGAKELNLRLFEQLENVLDSLAAQDLEAVRHALGKLTYSVYSQAYRLGINLDESLARACADRRAIITGQREAPEHVPPSGAITTNTILLVEDDPDEQALARYAFHNAGFEGDVVVAKDGVEALDYMHARGSHQWRNPLHVPRVVFLDIKLPKLGGFDVLKAIRDDARTALVPVVMLTNSDEEQDRQEGYALGANSYVNKPHDFESFVESVNDLSSYWTAVNRSPYQ